MSIVVVCKACHKRFKVSEKFAGQKGPCPDCKAVIYVPKADEEVKIHTAEHSEEHARGAGGEFLLKPIERQATSLPIWAWSAIGAASLAVIIGAFLLRPDGPDDPPNQLGAVIGLVILTPPLIIGAYAFLRDDGLEPHRGIMLWVRAGICSAIYLGMWAAYSRLPEGMTGDLWKWSFLGPVIGAIGATAAFATFDLEFGNAFFHFCCYAGVTFVLGMAVGFSMF